MLEKLIQPQLLEQHHLVGHLELFLFVVQRHLDQLCDWLRIPSISSQSAHDADIVRAAGFVAAVELLKALDHPPTVEVLTPDFRGQMKLVDRIIDEMNPASLRAASVSSIRSRKSPPCWRANR